MERPGPLPMVPEAHRVDGDGICWICRLRPADSREHRFKLADMRRAYGNGPCLSDSAPVRVVEGGDPRPIQGPRSKNLTFAPLMCATCNNDLTSAADLAYDVFISYFEAQQTAVFATRSIDLDHVFGSDRVEQAVSLQRYFAKHIGCRLAEARVEVPVLLQKFVNQESQQLRGVALNFDARLDIAALERHLRSHGDDTPTFWAGTLACQYSQSTGAITEINGFLGYRWLRISYALDSVGRLRGRTLPRTLHLTEGTNVDPNTIGNSCKDCSDT